jgi:hypothetical protein
VEVFEHKEEKEENLLKINKEEGKINLDALLGHYAANKRKRKIEKLFREAEKKIPIF